MRPEGFSKLTLPTVETCRWRRPLAGESRAACGLVAELLGVSPGGLVAVDDATCAACCLSFPPSRRMPNPVVAGLLFSAASRVLGDGGTAGCGVEAAEQARMIAERWITLRLPGSLRVTPARGSLPCAWLGGLRPEGGTVSADDGPIRDCEHPDHVTASPSTCRACPDWARRRPISRPMTADELVPLPPVRHGPRVRDWAIAITTAPRREPTLEACLDGVFRAGWDDPRLFLDGSTPVPPRHAHLPTTWREEGVGAWPAWYLALAELVVQKPNADAYLMLQDDVVLLDRGPLRDYLERALWPGERPGVVSLFYTGDGTSPGWHPHAGDWPWGAQTFLFPPGLARAFLADPGVMLHLLNASARHHTPIPTVVFQWAARKGIDFWYATPSLAQHIGNASAIWAAAALTEGRRAPWFAGDIDQSFALEDDPADFPEPAFRCDPAHREDYRRGVERGLDRMRGLRVVFCVACRDARQFLPRLAARVERLGGLLRDYRVLIVDEGSTDATPEFLGDWQAADPRVEVLATTTGAGKHPRSLERLRERAVEAHADFDHAIVVDADIAGGWSHDGVAHTFGVDGWDFVGSLGVDRVPAIVSAPPRYRHHDPRASIDLAESFPGRGGPLIAVDSCFGGLGIYRMACFAACTIEGGDHAEFQARLRRIGLGRVFLNPSQVVLHSPA